MAEKAGKGRKAFRIVTTLFIVLVAAVMSILYIFVAPNVRSAEADQKHYLYIHEKDNFEDVLEHLREGDAMVNTGTFSLAARLFRYDKRVRPGKYLLADGMSNLSLIRKLRNGAQEPVKLIINNIRTREQLAALVSRELMTDSASFINMLNNDTVMAGYGLTTATAVTLFIPNTYELYWNTDAGEFMDRMKKEYNRFWTTERIAKASAIPMTAAEVMTLASIIEEETNKRHEYPVIAGLYINRLKIGMPLQACPTIRFALNDYTIKRVLFGHLKTESPYNTYKYKGLPPGPIRLPSIVCIDAVLNHEKHDFLFMTAKESLNGEHNFAKTGEEHMRNARNYQKALDERGIR